MKQIFAGVAVVAALAIPGVAAATTFTGVGAPDIQVPTFEFTYDPTTNQLVGASGLNPVSTFTDADGNGGFLFNTSIEIDVEFEDDGTVLDDGGLGSGNGLEISGAFTPSSTIETLLTGVLLGVSNDADTILLEWDLTGGTLLSEFNSGQGQQDRALTLISATNFDDATGFTVSVASNPGGANTDTQGLAQVGMVPVPAGLPLLLTALGGLGYIARRRSTARAS